jgi:hypothetical protein
MNPDRNPGPRVLLKEHLVPNSQYLLIVNPVPVNLSLKIF